MPRSSRYPGFHRHVTKTFLVVIFALAGGLPILHAITEHPTWKQIIVIIAFVIVSYVVYWLVVRLNCYGTPLLTEDESNNNNNNNRNRNNNNTDTIYSQFPSNSSTTSTHSSSNGGTNNNHPTFASYRLGGLTEIIRRIGGSNGASTANDDEEIGEVIRPPPPNYDTALKGAGLPPPYANDPVDINVQNSESTQMSERYVPPRHPEPSIPSSGSLRRPVPPIPSQRSSTQSTQDTSQDPPSPIISDSPPKRPVPSIPQSAPQSPRRPVPSVPTSSSQTLPTLPPRLYNSISNDSNIN